MVILGAGFDSKVYYLDSLKDCSVFEVDNELVFGVKNKVLSMINAQVNELFTIF